MNAMRLCSDRADRLAWCFVALIAIFYFSLVVPVMCRSQNTESAGEAKPAASGYSQAGALRDSAERTRAYRLLDDASEAFKSSRYDTVISNCTEAVSLDGELVDGLYLRALAYVEKGLHEKAIEDCTRAIKTYPKRAIGYSHRGFAQLRWGHYSAAIDDYSLAIGLCNSDGKAYCGRGHAYYCDGQFDKALADFQQALKLNQDDVNAIICMANVYSCCPKMQLRNAEKSIEFATKAWALKGGRDYDVVSALACAYAEAGQFENALKYADAALKLASNMSEFTLIQRKRELFKEGAAYRDPSKSEGDVP